LIGALRDEGLALANIRQRLAPLSDEQAIEVAGELDTYLERADDVGFTTLGLIEAALASRNLAEPDTPEAASTVYARMSIDRPSMALEEPRSFSTEPTRGSASDYLNRVLRNPSAPPAPMPRPKLRVRKPVDGDRPEAWYYFLIEDGIELRVREDRYRESAGRLRAVTDALRATLRRYGFMTRSEDSS
jgi:hypothetical protein